MCLHHDFQANHGDKDPRADSGHMLATWPETKSKKSSEKSPHRPARARCEDHCTRGKDRQKGKQLASFRPPKPDEEGEERSTERSRENGVSEGPLAAQDAVADQCDWRHAAEFGEDVPPCHSFHHHAGGER